MFATRSQNENAIYDQQTAAAAKSLNAGGGVKGLAPKTPGQKAPPPKTPFKAPLNDENATLLGGKAGGGKAKDGGLFGGKATGGKAERNAFQTPAGEDTLSSVCMISLVTNQLHPTQKDPAPPTARPSGTKPPTPSSAILGRSSSSRNPTSSPYPPPKAITITT